MAWPDGATNETVQSIGATGRNHSTIAAWEAATDVDLVASGYSPVGECYDDADLAGFVMDGATTSADYYRRLTVAVGQRHDGTAYGGGVNSVGADYTHQLREFYGVVEWLICSGSDALGLRSYGGPENSRHWYRSCVVACSGEYGFCVETMGAGSEVTAENCVVHSAALYGFYYVTTLYNCSILGANRGVRFAACYNVISIGGVTACFADCTGSNNISGDATDAGGDTINNVDKDDIFTNTGGGTEDLHLKSDVTAASGAGADLSAYFTTDIDGDTRVDWDIGADEYAAGGPTFNPSWYVQRRRAREAA